MTSHARPIAMPPSLLCWSALLLACSAGAAQEPGSRSFDRQLALEDSAAPSANVNIGDVNSDGHQDIVLVKGRHWPLENLVLLGDGSGSFQPAYPVGQPDRSYSGVLVDMDRDGDLDLVVSNDNPDAKLVHLNDGNGRFTIGSMYGQPEWSTRHISVADLNDDSLPDVVLANRSGGDSGVSYICFGVEGGRFETECVGFARGSATTITPADFNNDGAVDLAVPHRDGGQSFIYLNDGEGGFEERRPFGLPTAAIRSAKAADLDRDGRLDLVVIDERSGPGILWGRADGTYAPVERLGASQARPYSIAVADLDRNGRMDVIVGFVESRPVVYFNDGPEAFVPVPFGDEEGVAYGFAVGDLDEDGLLDIAMARSGAKNMVYFGSYPSAEKADTASASTDATHCFVLPGSRSGATQSYRVVEGGGLEEAGEVSGGAMHMRAAFHPDGRTLYVNSVGPAGWGAESRIDAWEDGIHVRAYAYDPADCSMGAMLGTGRMAGEAPDNQQAYGLEVHPNGRYLYQTTNSLRRIRLFDLPDDRVPVPREAFDATAGGEHACVQVRRIAVHPSARYLYANCNNGGGVEDALQLWAIEGDGSLTLLDHYPLPPVYAGVYDPVVHPSGDWLYQPVGSTSREPAEGIGAILVYRIARDGRLALHGRVAVRALAAAELPPDTGYIGGGPITMVLHPDAGTAYVAVNAVMPEREVSPHGFAIYGVEDGGARLVERAWLPALRETRFSDHHGAILAAYDDDLYLYSFLTDYDTIQGGVLQRLHVAGDHSLQPLDPPWVPTGLFDGRQPIAMPGNGRAAEARHNTSGVILVHPDPMVAPSPDGRLLAHVDWSTGDLAVRDLDSGDVGRLTANPAPYEDGFANSPRFAPDGERVAFTWWNAATGRAELRVVSIDPAALEAMGTPRTIRRMDYGWIEANGWTPDGARIVAWTLSERGDNRIVLVSPDDGRTDVVRSFEWRVPLSVHPHPGGRYLAFDYQTSADEFTRDIRLLDLEEDHEIELVTHPANDYVLGWSPDGRHLVFASDRSGSVDAWALPFDAGGAAAPPRVITQGVGPMAPVEITASGQLFYAAVKGGQDVFVARLDPETRTVAVQAEPVAEPDGAERLSPDWSPEGQRLAWVRNVGLRPRATGHQAIAVRTFETGQTRLISLAPRLSHLRTPRWIDSHRLVLSARDEPSNTVRLYALDTRTGEASLLVRPDSGAAIEEPVPGPRGRTLYYRENRENPDGERVQRVVRRDLRSGEEATLFSTESGEGAGWRLQRLALSPDGERLALTLQRRGAAERLLVVPARGGSPRSVSGFGGGGHVTLAWSADGRTIWFTRRADGAGDEPPWELWWIDPQSGEHASAGLVEEGLAGLTFDPIGTRIAFTAGRRSYEIRAIPLPFQPRLERDGEASGSGTM